MTDEANTATPAPAEPKKAPITEAFYFKADGKEADSPLDSVTKFQFRLVAADKSWFVDYGEIRAALELAGIANAEINSRIAHDAFGCKTKWNNLANSIRNGKLKGTAEAGPLAQAEAIDDFLAEVAKGNWRGEAGEFVAGTQDLAEAIAAIQTRAGATADSAVIKTKLDAMTPEARKTYRDREDVKLELGRIRLARMEAKAKASAAPLPALEI